MRSLVEAKRDGRLAAKERASVERHLKGCVSCVSLLDDLDALSTLGQQLDEPPELSELEHRRRRMTVLRAAASPKPAAQQQATNTRLAPLLAAAALALLVVAAVLRWSAPALIVAQPVLPQDSFAPAPVAAVAATVSQAPRARFERQSTRGPAGVLERVRLYDGTVDVRVAKLERQQRFIVATRDAEVEVRGTRFSVRAVSDELREVVVQEGRVELRRGVVTLILHAGESWRAPDDDEPQPADAVSAEPSDAPSATPSAPSAREASAAEPEPAATATTAEAGAAPTPKPNDASREFAEAVARLERGDHRGASEALRDFHNAHPSDALSEDAAFLSAVALQRAGRHAAAAQAARRYLQLYPNGSRRADAEAIVRAAKRSH